MPVAGHQKQIGRSRYLEAPASNGGPSRTRTLAIREVRNNSTFGWVPNSTELVGLRVRHQLGTRGWLTDLIERSPHVGIAQPSLNESIRP